jgi:hypothetical protein
MTAKVLSTLGPYAQADRAVRDWTAQGRLDRLALARPALHRPGQLHRDRLAFLGQVGMARCAAGEPLAPGLALRDLLAREPAPRAARCEVHGEADLASPSAPVPTERISPKLAQLSLRLQDPLCVHGLRERRALEHPADHRDGNTVARSGRGSWAWSSIRGTRWSTGAREGPLRDRVRLQQLSTSGAGREPPRSTSGSWRTRRRSRGRTASCPSPGPT